MPDVTAGRRRGGGLAVAPTTTVATHRWLAHCRSSIDSAGTTIRTPQLNGLGSDRVAAVQSVRSKWQAVPDPGCRSQRPANRMYSTSNRDPECEGRVATRFAELRTYPPRTSRRIETTVPSVRSRAALQATCHHRNSRPPAVGPREYCVANRAPDTAGRMPFAPERTVRANPSRPIQSD